jgi:hypothetical protein
MKVGEINGGWSVMIRINTVLLPIAVGGIITLGVWAVKNINDHDKRIAVMDEWRAGRMAAWTAMDLRMGKAEESIDKMQNEIANEKLNLGNKLNDLSTEVRLIKDQMDRLIKSIERHINKEEKSVSFIP